MDWKRFPYSPGLRAGAWARRSALAALLASVLLPGGATAQICLGNPAMPGQFTLSGGASFSETVRGASLQGRANLDGPMSIGAGVGILDPDALENNVTTLQAGVAYDRPVEGFEACGVVSVRYSTWQDRIPLMGEEIEGDFWGLALPLGIAVGSRLNRHGRVHLIPAAEAGIFYSLLRVSAEPDGGRFTDSESEMALYVDGGATVLYGRIFARAGLSRTTVRGAEFVWSLLLGLRF